MRFEIPWKYRAYLKYVYAIAFGVLGGIMMAKSGVVAAAALIAIPIVLVYIYYFAKNPKIGLYTAFIIAFLIPTVGRYVPGNIPLGLGVDISLVLTLIFLILRDWKRVDFSGWNHIFPLLMIVWMAFTIFQLANPMALSVPAWFYAMRGLSLYQLLMVIICFVFFYQKKDFKNFVRVWLIFSVIGILWGMKQKIIGLDAFENKWLMSGAYVTHLLFGKLRIFSYYTDAGIFGPAMGSVTIFCGIMALGPWSMRRRIVYGLISVFALYAMLISGTRGALAVPGAGGILYLILIRNKKLLITGGSIMLFAFVFLKYTTIGSGNYDIQRLRSALDPNDASLNVRVENRKMLRAYLSDKPLGTGIGSAGFWGQRFTPWTWMANFPTDGLYTRVRAETGVIGYTLYVYTWIFLLVYGSWHCWQYKDKERQYYSMAALANFAGILAASYGNEILNQIPVNFTVLVPLAFVFTMKYWNEDGVYQIPEERKHKIFK
jgi:hypothetical protein